VTDARRSARLLESGRYIELRYEDLVVEPDAQLRHICGFLGEDFDPAMLHFQNIARAQIPAGTFHDAVRNPLNMEGVGRWRREMSPGELRIFEAIAGQTLVELGYPLAATGGPSTGERIRIGLLSGKYALYRTFRAMGELVGLRMPN
jgi:hypothetical protein